MNTDLYDSVTIKVAGDKLDNLRYYEYSDFPGTKPTEAESLAKAIAYCRMRFLKEALCDISIPMKCEITFATAGTAKAIPQDATIELLYIDYTAFQNSPYNTVVPADPQAPTKAERKAMMVDAIKNLVAARFANQHEFREEVIKLVTRKDAAGDDVTYDFPVITPITVPAGLVITA